MSQADPLLPHLAEPALEGLVPSRYARSCGAYSVALFLLKVDIDIALDMFTTVEQFQRKLMEMRAMIVKVEAEQDALQSGEAIARGNREAA